jgi:hypothetical protein
VDDGAQVDLELPRDALRRLVLERRDGHDPGVVDEHVDGPEGPLDLVQEGGEAGEIGHVEVQADGAAAQLRGGALCRLAVDVADRDAHPLAGQRQRERLPDPPATARHYGDLAAQRAWFLGHAFSSSSTTTRRQQ